MAVSLTYAGVGPETAVLSYSDVQKFFKRLRNSGYRVRYIGAGEYGSDKGRSHWHVVLFFNGAYPQLHLAPFGTKSGRRQWIDEWPHGHIFPQVAEYGGFRYMLKYFLKSEDLEVSDRKLFRSKNPPLGMEFFKRVADRMVSERIAFHAPTYSFADVLQYDKRLNRMVPRQFYLQGRTLQLMCDYYCQQWRNKYWELPPQTEFLMERFLDPEARARIDAAPDYIETVIRQRQLDREVDLAAAERANRAAEPTVAFSLLPEQHGLAVLRRDGSLRIVPNDGGEEEWLVDVRGRAVEDQLRGVGLTLDQAIALTDWAHWSLREDERMRLLPNLSQRRA